MSDKRYRLNFVFLVFLIIMYRSVFDVSDNRFFLTIDDTCEVVGLSRSTIFRMEKNGEFPKRQLLGKRKKGYRKDDLLEWVESRS